MTNHNKVLKFHQFINEDAYIDDSGELRDLEFTPQEQHENSMFDEMMYIVDFLEDAGAIHVKPEYYEGMMKFPFKYNREDYEMFIDIDDDFGSLIKYASPLSKGTTIFDGPAEELFDLLKSQGLSFLD
jgi:hypothetical protein